MSDDFGDNTSRYDDHSSNQSHKQNKVYPMSLNGNLQNTLGFKDYDGPITVVNTADMIKVNKMKYSEVSTLIDHLKHLRSRHPNSEYNLCTNLSNDAQILIENTLLQHNIIDEALIDTWMNDTPTVLVKYMEFILKQLDTRFMHNEQIDIMVNFHKLKFAYDPSNLESYYKFEVSLIRIWNDLDVEYQNESNMDRIVKFYLNQIRKSAPPNYGRMLASYIEAGGLPTRNIRDFVLKLRRGIKQAQDANELYAQYNNSSDKFLGKRKEFNDTTDTLISTEINSDIKNLMCEGCGRANSHKSDDCKLYIHPDFNKDYKTKKFSETEAYRTLLNNPKIQYKCLSPKCRADGKPLDSITTRKILMSLQKSK